MKITTSTVVACALALAGCASISNGTSQMISLQAVDPYGMVTGVNCTLTNHKGTWYARTPAYVTIHRAYGRLLVKCEKAGYEPSMLTAKSRTKNTLLGNLMFGGAAGAAVDITDGSGYDYPQYITVTMTPETPEAPHPQAANANTVNVQGDEGVVTVSGPQK